MARISKTSGGIVERLPSRLAKAPASGPKRDPGVLGVHFEASIPYGPSLVIERYRLDNGLRLLLLPDSSAPVAAIHTWFRVGSRHERPGKTGLAHLLEHLMFGEFDGLPHGEYDRRLEEAGAETNAATWLDWTYYYANVPSSQLPKVIDLEARRMSTLVLSDDCVKSELDVVTNERRYRIDDDVDGAVSEKLYELAFTKHAYRLPTVGWEQDIRGLTRSDCEQFYRTYYAPNNATLVIAGKLDRHRTIEHVVRAYGHMESIETPVEDSQPEPPQSQERRLELVKPTATPKLAMAYHGPALGDVDQACLALLFDILFGGRSSRVHHALVREAEIASDVHGWVGTTQEPGLLEVHATAREGHTTEELLEALDGQLEAVRSQPVGTDELERSKARSELGMLRSLETCAGRAEQIAFFDTMVGDPAGAFQRLERLRRATRSDLLRVARRYLDGQARSVIEVQPGAKRAEEAS